MRKSNLTVKTNRNRDALVQEMFDLVVHALSSHWGFSREGIRRAADDSGVSRQTIYNWLNGKVCKPQYLTLAKVLEAAGYQIEITPIKRKPNLRRIK